MNLVAWWQQAALVAFGGALGSFGRFAIGTWMARLAGTGFPWGTLTVNLAGSFLAGLALVWLDGRGDMAAWWRAFVMVGVIGGFTTWSALMVEVLMLGRGTTPAWAGTYVLVSLIGGLLLVWAGWRLGIALRVL